MFVYVFEGGDRIIYDSFLKEIFKEWGVWFFKIIYVIKILFRKFESLIGINNNFCEIYIRVSGL